MAYNPTAYYSSRGAEYGQTGAAGRAAGIGDVLKEKAAAKKSTRTATGKLEKKAQKISFWQGLSNIVKTISKAAIIAGKSDPITGTLLTMATHAVPTLLEKAGVKGYEKVESPEYSKKYDVYEPYEEAFEGARGSIRSELGMGSLLTKGGSTLLDLYTTKHSKEMLDKLLPPGTSEAKPDVSSIFSPTQQDLAKEATMSAFGAEDMSQLYDLLSGQDDLDFFSSTYETSKGATDWEKYYSDFMGSRLGKG